MPDDKTGPFQLALRTQFADLHEINGDSDLDAAVAITEAIQGQQPLILAVGAQLAVDLLADNEGFISGYRILAELPGMTCWLASDILSAADYGAVDGDDGPADVTVAVLQSAADTGNQLLADYLVSPVQVTYAPNHSALALGATGLVPGPSGPPVPRDPAAEYTGGPFESRGVPLD